MKQLLTSVVIGILIIFGMLGLGVGFHSVAGENSGKLLIVLISFFGLSFLIGVVAREALSETRIMKNINRWAKK